MDEHDVLTWLKRRGTRRNREGMARYGIRSPRAFGVSMATMRPFVKRIGKSHTLAEALWRTEWLEARLLAALIDDPRLVTRRQMSAWAANFDNWAICDACCFHLFDRTPFAWDKARSQRLARERSAPDSRTVWESPVNRLCHALVWAPAPPWA